MNCLKWIIPMLFCFLIVENSFANKQTHINNGILDLRNKNIADLDEIEFSGQWEFYWNVLLYPEDFNTINKLKPTFVKVPSVWNNYTINSKKLPAKGFATYRLRILTGDKSELAIKLGSISTAVKVFANNIEIYQAGKVAKTKNDAVAAYKPGVAYFMANSDTTDIIIQVSNYHYSKSGIWNNFNKIGSKVNIDKSWSRDNQISILLIGCMLIFALYHLGLYLLNLNFRYTLYFSLFCFILIIRTLVVSEIILLNFFPLFNWETLIKLEYLTLLLGNMSFSLFIYKFFQKDFRINALKYILFSNTIFSLIVLISTASFYTNLLIVFQINILISCAYILYIVIKAITQGNKLALILFVGFLFLLASIINDMLYTHKIINTTYLTSYGFMVFIFSQAYMLSANFSALFVKTESLANKLEITNLNLESLVERRTLKIQEQNTVLVDQSNEIRSKNQALEQVNDEIKAQRDNLQKQNKIVLKQKKQITSSIEYASRIQSAVIDSTNEITLVAPNHFILFHPKDIVSGDFYWFKELVVNDKKYKIVTVVDCTGHGVPGAFMSILGALFLDKVCNEIKGIPKASEILNQMRIEVKALLQQQTEAKTVKDGMDMALVVMDYDEMNLQFSGAQNPLYIIRNVGESMATEIEEYKGDNMPIGTYIKEKESFTNYTIDINKGDLVYLFSDGYYDQFGGEMGKKFKKINFKQVLLNNAHLPLSQQHLKLDKTLLNWKGEYDQIDDITVMGIKI